MSNHTSQNKRNRRNKRHRPYEQAGISVICPECGAPSGTMCHGRLSPHDDRRKRAAVFAERRIEGVLIQQRLRAGKKRPPGRLSDGKRHRVTVKQIADLSATERGQYGVAR
jgi:hypothetical protein